VKLPHQKKSKEENRHGAATRARKKVMQETAYWATLYQASPDVISSALSEYPDICDVVHRGFKARAELIHAQPRPGEFESELRIEVKRRHEAERKAMAEARWR